MEGLPEIEKKLLTTAQLLDNDGDWSDRNMGRELYGDLQQLDAKHVTNSIVLQVIRNDPMRLQILILAIKLGIQESEEKLASLLMIYGDKSMAEDYLNCGSSMLDKAGTEWANAHGYYVATGDGSHRATWGEF